MDGPSLRVILNDRALHGPRTGVGHYVAELITALCAQERDIDLLAFYENYLRRSRWGAAITSPSRAGRPARRAWSGFRPLAQGLYDDFSQGADRVLHGTLDAILQKYFKAGMETLTY